MSGLRRRVNGFFDSTTGSSRDGSPAPGEEIKVIAVRSLDALKKKTTTKRKNTFIFGLGGLFGIIIALLFARHQDVINFEGIFDVHLDSIMDVIPAGIIKDARDITKAEREATNYDAFAVGMHARSQGIRAQHPIIMIPGVISTGLESWATDDQYRQYFRKRLWGSWSMMRALVLDKAAWKKHLMLDKITGLDPPGIKLRAAQGFDATDFFITGYWIWNKILENLATIGYDPINAFSAAYDWRLTYMNLEVRDQYFTRLKNYIEVAHQTSGFKPVLASHSMGGQVFLYFMKWVEHKDYGKGGPSWVNDHIEAWINISGCLLGAAKGISAVLSGEMKDTVQLNAFAIYGLERFLSREERAELFRAMPGISSMLPKGGEDVWGNLTWAPDDMDPPAQNHSFGPFISFKPPINSTHTPHVNLTVMGAMDYLMSMTEPWYKDMVMNAYSHGVAHTSEEVEINEDIPRKWLNPLETRLPLAPDMKIYCFYGIGKPTERGYFYKESHNPFSPNINTTIDTSFSTKNGFVSSGVIFGEGDGTVNLLSTAYICSKPWRNITRYNPAKIPITTFEMPHEPDRFSPRGGPNTGEHVDILGRASLNDLILRIAGGRGHEIQDKYVSRIWDIAERVRVYENEE